MPFYSFNGGAPASGKVIVATTLASDALSGATSLVFTSVPNPAPAIGMPISGPGIQAGTTIATWTVGTKTATISLATTALIKAGVAVYITASPAIGGALSSADIDNIEYLRSPNTLVFTATSTYNPTVGTRYCVVEMVGAGGGVTAMTANSGGVAISSGGASGSYIKLQCLPTDIWGQVITVGSGNTGLSGGASSIGSLIVAPGGPAPGTVNISSASLPANSVVNASPTNPPSSSTYSVGTVILQVQGQGSPVAATFTSGINATAGICMGAAGGSNPLGTGGEPGNDYAPFNRAPAVGKGYGSGCGSAVCSNNSSTVARAGQNGVVIITEYF